ncbi:hypothetical protein AGMMS50267_00280 [Spirochaetia bacterium]|nr:hypothetical protein AGMMS50267_00280 [Spirochaetia bacterium]
MKKTLNILVLCAAALTFAACAQTSRSVQTSKSVKTGKSVKRDIGMSSSFDEVQGKAWVLDELVRESGGTAIINRQKLDADGFGDAYTLMVDTERISGKGAPNRYFSPYTLGPDQKISINPIAGTLMASLVEPEGLKEREYYSLLEQVNQWQLTGGKLKLYSKTPNGEPVILIYTAKDQ